MYFSRKEAILSGANIAPKNREEAFLLGHNVKPMSIAEAAMWRYKVNQNVEEPVTNSNTIEWYDLKITNTRTCDEPGEVVLLVPDENFNIIEVTHSWVPGMAIPTKIKIPRINGADTSWPIIIKSMPAGTKVSTTGVSSITGANVRLAANFDIDLSITFSLRNL